MAKLEDIARAEAEVRYPFAGGRAAQRQQKAQRGAFVAGVMLIGAVLPTCRVCGCTEVSACDTPHGPCCWAEPDLCSAPACLEKATS